MKTVRISKAKTLMAIPFLFWGLGGIGKAYANNSEKVKADNAAVNARDRNDATLTPEDQAQGSDRDVELTRLIRQELTRQDGLSTYAQNVKIITLNGKVTLRGPVRTLTEKQRVASAATKVVGAPNVANELEVTR